MTVRPYTSPLMSTYAYSPHPNDEPSAQRTTQTYRSGWLMRISDTRNVKLALCLRKSTVIPGRYVSPDESGMQKLFTVLTTTTDCMHGEKTEYSVVIVEPSWLNVRRASTSTSLYWPAATSVLRGAASWSGWLTMMT